MDATIGCALEQHSCVVKSVCSGSQTTLSHVEVVICRVLQSPDLFHTRRRAPPLHFTPQVFGNAGNFFLTDFGGGLPSLRVDAPARHPRYCSMCEAAVYVCGCPYGDSSTVGVQVHPTTEQSSTMWTRVIPRVPSTNWPPLSPS
jgi:hypothetical protein